MGFKGDDCGGGVAGLKATVADLAQRYNASRSKLCLEEADSGLSRSYRRILVTEGIRRQRFELAI